MSDFGLVIVSGLDFHGGIGNESHIPNYISDAVKAAGLSAKAGGFQTMQVQTTNFTGNIKLEASLSKDPNNGPWVSIPIINTLTGDSSTQLTFKNNLSVVGTPNFTSNNTNAFYTITGQYAWLRANISNISDGILSSIKLSY